MNSNGRLPGHNRLEKRRVPFLFMYVIIIALICFTACEGREKRPFAYDFESDEILDRLSWKCKTVFSLHEGHSVRNKHSLKIDFYPSPYPGISLAGFDPDWSGREFFLFHIYNPEKREMDLVLRIDDSEEPSYKDRVNDTLKVRSGENSYKIKLASLVTSGTERTLNLKSVKKVIFFLVNPAGKRTLYFDDIRIE